MPLTKKQIQNRKTLVDALRSGKYKQAKNALRDPMTKGFCCQGVACDLFKDEVNGKWVRPEMQSKQRGTLFKSRTKNFIHIDSVKWPLEVQYDLLGIDTDDSDNLIRMNDGRMCGFSVEFGSSYTLVEQCTFDEIADCIELLTLAGL